MNEFKKPLLNVVGAAFVGSLAAGCQESTEAPFQADDLESGVEAATEGSCGEGKCGEGKAEEGSCGEGKCGEDKGAEGQCGEGKCGEEGSLRGRQRR